MKVYEVTADEMTALAVLQGGAAVCVAIASFSGGVWLSAIQAMDFADKASAVTIAKWEAYQTCAIIVTISTLVIAAVLGVIGGSKIRKIKQDTIHD